MNTDSLKRCNLVCGWSAFLIGCGCLILLTITIQHMAASIEAMIGPICFFVFTVISFYMSINSFIKYGISLGIDYALEQQSLTKVRDAKKVMNKKDKK